MSVLGAAFVQRWMHPDYPPEMVQLSDLEAAEHELSFRFPEAYRALVTTVGLVAPTTALWDRFSAINSELPHLAEFLSPSSIIESTADWREMGLPVHLVPFAIDSGGNLICLSSDGSPSVWLFDHDFGDANEIAPGFEAYLQSYVSA